MKRTIAVLALIIPIIFQTALAQWTFDSGIASAKSGDFEIHVMCNSIVGTYIEVEVNRRMTLMEDSDGEYFVGLAWNGDDHNFDFPLSEVRQDRASDPKSLIISGFFPDTGALSASIHSLIRKLKAYSSVKVLMTDSSGGQHFTTFSLKGSSNAINRVQQSCGK